MNDDLKLDDKEIEKLKNITTLHFAMELEHALRNDLIKEDISILEFIKIILCEIEEG